MLFVFRYLANYEYLLVDSFLILYLFLYFALAKAVYNKVFGHCHKS